jgi:hypothetical protein
MVCYIFHPWSLTSSLFIINLHLPQVSLEWVLIGYIQFIMRSVLNLKQRTRETCKTRHSLIFTGNNNKISRGGKARVYCKNANLPWKKGYRFCEICH